MSFCLVFFFVGSLAGLFRRFRSDMSREGLRAEICSVEIGRRRVWTLAYNSMSS